MPKGVEGLFVRNVETCSAYAREAENMVYERLKCPKCSQHLVEVVLL